MALEQVRSESNFPTNIYLFKVEGEWEGRTVIKR